MGKTMTCERPAKRWPRPIRAVAAVVVAMLVAGVVAMAAPVSAAEEAPLRERNGPGVTEVTSATPGDGDIVPTPTPTLSLDSGNGEIVVRDANGAVVTTSGEIAASEWTVPQGVLSPGGSYSWEGLSEPGDREYLFSAPHYSKDAGFSGTLRIAGSDAPVDVIQDPRQFSVETDLGLKAEASGMHARFWPHTDFSDFPDADKLPATLKPAAGSEVVTVEPDTSEYHEKMHLCPHYLTYDKYGKLLNKDEIICQIELGFDVTYPERTAGAAAAAHNIEGRNVAHNFEASITQANVADPNGGLVLSTSGKDVISGAFAAQSGFGYRMTGYMTVPETGSYTFGTTSPGGSRALLYDSTDTELGRTELSAPDAWQPAELDGACAARSDIETYKNKQTRKPNIHTMGDRTYHTYFYEYDAKDDTWVQPADETWKDVVAKLEAVCGVDDVIRWGEPVHLEAGRPYPLDLAGWVGVSGGEIGFYVDGPTSGSMPVPVDWLTPADVIDFERTRLPVSTLDDHLVGWTLNGYGTELVGIDPAHGIVTYTPDGLGGWNPAGGIEDLVDMSQPRTVYPLSAEDSVLDRFSNWEIPADEAAGQIALANGYGWLDGGQITASGSELQPWGEKIVTLTIDELSFRLDENGTVVDGSVTGRVAQPNSAGHPLQTVAGDIDADGNIRLVLSGQHGERADLLFPVDAAGFVAGSFDPYAHPAAFHLADGDVELLSRDGGQIDGTPDGHLIIEGGKGRLGANINAGGTSWGPGGPVYANVTISGLDFDLDAAGNMVNGNVDGSMQVREESHGDEYFTPITSVSGRLDKDTNTLQLRATNGRGDGLKMTLPIALGHLNAAAPDQLAVSDAGETLVVASAPWAAGDVKLVTKVDDSQPFSDANVEVVSLNEVYQTAGITPPSAAGTLPQAVQVTPDGNTVAVMQPDGDGYRVDVVDRTTAGSPWQFIGSFNTEAAGNAAGAVAPFAVGRDLTGNYRYLAVVNGSDVDLHYKYRTAPWQLAMTQPAAGPVTSMSFDYYAEHLAIGQPTAGSVTVVQREVIDTPRLGDRHKTNWIPDRTLTGADISRFGSTVNYSGYGLLAVTGDGSYTDTAAPDYTPGQMRLYLDVDPVVSWGTVAAWTTVELGRGTGPHVVTSQAGTTTAPQIAAATVNTLYSTETTAPRPGQAPIQLF